MSETETQYTSPSNQCLQHVVKIAVVDDKPIMLDYWTNSQDNKVLIGVRENGEKLLVKSEDEYTSPIEKIYKVEGEYILKPVGGVEEVVDTTKVVVEDKVSSNPSYNRPAKPDVISPYIKGFADSITEEEGEFGSGS